MKSMAKLNLKDSVKLLSTEKSNALQELCRTYVFQFPKNTTKIDIKNYLKVHYKVEVECIRTSTITGKRYRAGKTYNTYSDLKKVYAKLKHGYKLDNT